MNKNILKFFFLLVPFFLSSGCATILGGLSSKVYVKNGYPSNAQVYLNNEFKGNAPCYVPVKRKLVKANNAGSLTIKANGFEDYEVGLHKKTWGGIIFADILYGVVPLIIDAAAGNLFKVVPQKIKYNLTPKPIETKPNEQVVVNTYNNNSGKISTNPSQVSVDVSNQNKLSELQNASATNDNVAGGSNYQLTKEDMENAVVDMTFEAKKVSTKNTESADYRRSSLYTIMVQDPSQPHYNVIKNTFKDAPIPEKFNDHNLNVRLFNPDLISLNNTQASNNSTASIYKKALVSGLTGGIVNGATGKEKDLPEKVNHFLAANDIAKAMVAKWFNRNKNGYFNMDLIAERGQYNASDMDVKVANSSARGNALLSDAGEELIGNTFILVSYFKYVSKEEIANKTKALVGLANYIPGAGSAVNIATTATSAAVTIAGKGYVVKTTSYLYQLNWNDSIASIFYNDYWVDKSSPDESRVKAFENSKLFNLKYIGSDVAWADLQSSIFTKKSEEDLISIATVKAVDAVIAKLQKNHEVFRTKTPLYSTEPLTAKIGLKEGLEAGDKFDVLEKNVDDTGKTYYKKLTTIKVSKKQIWDNRYMASEENANATIDRTYFEGSSKGLYPGLLIKQSK